tara:strand:- start:232 stop:456 length:225 start_codon:yes stop_codon:yes gene_type:complete
VDKGTRNLLYGNPYQNLAWLNFAKKLGLRNLKFQACGREKSQWLWFANDHANSLQTPPKQACLTNSDEGAQRKI